MALFEGFERRHVQVGELSIHCVSGGQGDPVLLLHGYPQTLSEWALLAPLLAEKHTVVCNGGRPGGPDAGPGP
jgi:haloacetate dehalogenase